jgi:hypothetical protein
MCYAFGARIRDIGIKPLFLAHQLLMISDFANEKFFSH